MDLTKLIPSANNFEIYEFDPNEVSNLKGFLANVRKEVGQKDEVFSRARVLTLVMWPKIPRRRRVKNLRKCAENINALLARTTCISHSSNQVESYISGGYISAFEQSHMAEHLALPFLKYAQTRKKEIDAESVDLLDLGLGRIVTVFTGRYDHAVLKDILSFTWHWMGQAITKADFPNTIQFERMLRLRIFTIKNARVTLQDVKSILTAK